jgi:hypothetical protein
MIIPRFVNYLYLMVTMYFNQKSNKERGFVCSGGYALHTLMCYIGSGYTVQKRMSLK